MTSASNTAGMVGKFGQTSFMSLSSREVGPGEPSKKQSKFFKTRNFIDTEDSIAEEEEEVDKENLTNNSVFSTPMTNKRCQQTNLVVAVRIRPGEGLEQVLDVDDNQIIVERNENKIFKYDTVFDTVSSQETVYAKSVEGQVDKVLEGFNGTVMCYGQTGTGKTFTMGTEGGNQEGDNRGMVARALEKIFLETEKKPDVQMSVRVSFYEVNMEQVMDLLSPSQSRVPLLVRDLGGTFKICQLTEVLVTSVSEALDYLLQGSKLRATGSNNINAASSRSHAVFCINLTSVQLDDGSSITSKLNMVDLAGSESLQRTQATGNTMQEGVGINKGLLYLSLVVKALVKGSSYIPYRNAMLTKVLKESLQTNLITLIACLSPDKINIQETLNTLQFANDAKRLKVHPVPSNLLSNTTTPCHMQNKTLTPNQTIHTATPSKLKTGTKRTLNNTIGTPGGKRARGEPTDANFATPFKSKWHYSRVTSTAGQSSKKGNNRCQEDIGDISGISMIEPPDEENYVHHSAITSSLPVQQTLVQQADLSHVLSPLMRQIESLTRTVNTNLEWQKQFMQGQKQPSKTPVKRAKGRMTSSPNRELARRMEEGSSTTDIDDDSLTIPSEDLEVTVKPGVAPISPTKEQSEEEDTEDCEDIISGAGAGIPVMEKPTNKRIKQVLNSASPEFTKTPNKEVIPVYDSPASSSNKSSTQSPSIEEMAKQLGINPDSPIMFAAPVKPPNPPGTAKKPRRSSRRTTMMSSELNETLAEIRNMTGNSRRRSTRVAAQAKFYGSPSNSKGEKGEYKHPLMVDENWKVDKQKKHNENILNLLNTANMKVLQALPAVGPKSACAIHVYRDLNGEIKNLLELKSIQGLGRNFWNKFVQHNQISGLEDEENNEKNSGGNNVQNQFVEEES